MYATIVFMCIVIPFITIAPAIIQCPNEEYDKIKMNMTGKLYK